MASKKKTIKKASATEATAEHTGKAKPSPPSKLDRVVYRLNVLVNNLTSIMIYAILILLSVIVLTLLINVVVTYFEFIPTIVIPAFVITILIGIFAYFLHKYVDKIDATAEKVAVLDGKVQGYENTDVINKLFKKA